MLGNLLSTQSRAAVRSDDRLAADIQPLQTL